jgi:hypothetical protein
LVRLSVKADLCKTVKSAFQKYASRFRKAGDISYNQHMQVKQNHTARVCHEIKTIGKSLNFNEEQLAFAELIAWLHDIGRFEQFDRYGTFADAESENHSEIAVRVIEREGLLTSLDTQLKEIVYRCILNHNIPIVPENEPEQIDFYSRLLRDADKLDIWRLTLEMNIFHTIKTETMPVRYEIPERLLLCFVNEKVISLDSVQSFYDSILFRLSWIYDLNFTFSVEQVVKRKIAEQLISRLPFSKAADVLGNQVITYLKQFHSNDNSGVFKAR